MEFLKKVLRQFDVFGEPFSFKYNNKESYPTSLGGLFMILFFILSLYLIIYNLIAFIHRDNFSIVYYTMNISLTEKIEFKESKAALVFGFDYSTYGRFKVEEV